MHGIRHSAPACQPHATSAGPPSLSLNHLPSPCQSFDTFGDFGNLFGRRLFQADALTDPFAAPGGTGAGNSAAASDPFAAASSSGGDPFAAGSGGGSADPFAAAGGGSTDPFATSTSTDAAAAAIADVAWDLGGGFISGMAGGACVGGSWGHGPLAGSGPGKLPCPAAMSC